MAIQPGFRPIGAYDPDPNILDRQMAQLETNLVDAFARVGQQAAGALNVTNRKTGSARAKANDCIIVDSSAGNVTVTLPAPSPQNSGDTVEVVRISASNTVTVLPTTGLISGAASYVLAGTAWLRVNFLCIGIAWVVK